MAVARLTVSSPTHRRAASQTSPTRSSSTSAPTRRCCAPAARRACACSSPRTWRWGPRCTRWPTATRSTSAPSSTRSGACPRRIVRTKIVVMGQEAALFRRAGIGPLEEWDAVEAPGAPAALVRQRRRGARRPAGLGVGRRRPRADARRLPDRVEQDPPAHGGRRLAAGDGLTAEACAAALGGAPDDWARLADALGRALRGAPAGDRRRGQVDARAHARRHPGRLPAHDAALVGARARRAQQAHGSATRRCTSSPPTPTRSPTSSPGWRASARSELVAFVERGHHEDLQEELARFRDGRTDGAWENFLYFVARDFFDAGGTELRRKSATRPRSRRASSTSARRPRCGSPPRSSRWRAWTRRAWTRGWAASTPSAWRAARPSSSTPTTRSASPPTTCCARSPSTRPTCAASTSWARRRRSTPTSAT